MSEITSSFMTRGGIAWCVRGERASGRDRNRTVACGVGADGGGGTVRSGGVWSWMRRVL